MNKKIKVASIIFQFFTILISTFFYCDMIEAKEKILIVPTPFSVELKDFDVVLDENWSIVVDTSNENNLFCAKYLSEKLSPKNLHAISIEGSLNPLFGKNIFLGLTNEDFIKQLVKERNIIIPPEIGDEGYLLDISSDSVVVIANKSRGLFYGVTSFLQLIAFENEHLKVPGLKIIDYPKLKLRGVHILNIDYNKIEDQIDMMASMKINTVIFSDKNYFNLEQVSFRKQIKEIFNYARERFIEPVPEVAALGSAYPMLALNPHLAEGVWITDEHYKFVNDKAIPIKATGHNLVNVIRTKETDIEITNLEKSKIYKKDIDYRIIDGVISYPYDMTNQPTEIAKISNGDIKNGDEVLISYDYVENKCASYAPWNIPYCLSSEEARQVMFSAIKNTIELLNPKYIDLGYSEIGGMNKDSRCKRRNLTNAELLADDINNMYGFIKGINPEIKLMIWDDMINPWHNGGDENYQVKYGGIPGKTAPTINMIPKDIIIIVWWYKSNDGLGKMKQSPAYFEKKGFQYLVSSWKDKENIESWVEIANKKKGCLGMIATSWNGLDKNFSNIKYAASLMW
ncbi:hypothetical protein M0R36_07720 [bacterium]|jgi:hypothetical protein|nr:hypothetical protein [bacterium]